MNELRLYGCGGCGINIVKQASSLKATDTTVAINPVYIDASDANLREGFEKENKFVVDNLAGGGKVQAENAREIARALPTLLAEHPPAQFNVIVCSGSGASGSVIGTMLMKELLSKNIPVVALVVGTTESKIATENTLKTIMSIDGMARAADLSANVFFRSQDVDVAERDTNEEFISVIAAISVIASQRNQDLDIRDLHNFVFHNKMTKAPGQLMSLEIVNGEFESMVESFPSMVEILPGRDTPQHDASVIYRTVGYSKVEVPVRAYTTPALFPGIIEELQSQVKVYTDIEESLAKSKALSAGVESDDSGFCF